MMRSIGWSQDSARLLVGLRGGEGKSEMDGAYLYFHTGTKRWELTPYLRTLNKITSDILSATDDVLPFAESAGALLAQAEISVQTQGSQQSSFRLAAESPSRTGVGHEEGMLPNNC